MGQTSGRTVREGKKWYARVPHVFVLLLFIIVLCTILTYIVPAGKFERVGVEGTSQQIVVAGSYHEVEQSPVSFLGMFKAIPQGFAASASIIAMILFSAGAFQVMTESGAIENVLGVALYKAGKGKDIIVIWVVTFLFSIMGIFIGPEVHVPFTVITVAVALGMGFDVIVGVAMVLGGSIGFATAPILSLIHI